MTLLSDIKCKNAQATDKQYKLGDGNNLYLAINPTGSKVWIVTYTRLDKKRDKYTVGKYPAISLKQARLERDRVMALLENGTDPKQYDKQQEQQQQQEQLAKQTTVESVLNEWYSFKIANKAASTQRNNNFYIKHINSALGSVPLTELTRQQVSDFTRGIERQGKLETAKRCLVIIQKIIDFAQLEYNVADKVKVEGDKVVKSNAAITDPIPFAELLKKIDSYTGFYATCYALKILPHVFTRPNELLSLKWQNVDFDNKEIRYYATKTKSDHIVPLSNQVLALLLELKQINKHSEYVFASQIDNKQHLSNGTLNSALRRIGYTGQVQVAHGFRASARTMLAERLDIEPLWIECQLNHKTRDSNGTAYNRTKYLKQRVVMMQQWSDYLDNLMAC